MNNSQFLVEPSFDEDEYNFQYSQLEQAGFGDVLESSVMQKLGGVSFLGLLDVVYEIATPANRLQHTIGVAYLTLALSKKLKLDDHNTLVFVICAFLHDIGHAAFSHNSEPYLLETKKVYHTGVISRFFKSEPKTLVDLITKSYRVDRDRLFNDVLMLLNGSGKTNLQRLFHSPLNCDKIEGNARTGKYLGLPGVSPNQILEVFKIKDGDVFVDYSKLDLVDIFWNHEKELYWNKIYTNEVFASEALLTRALHLRFGSLGEEILLLTDRDVVIKLKEIPSSNELVLKIKERQYLKPLSEVSPNIFENYKELFKEKRFDMQSRYSLESEIAAILGIQGSMVISHFSRRKHFNGNTSTLRQLSLFEVVHKDIELAKIDEVLRRNKISGDFFEIFVSS